MSEELNVLEEKCKATIEHLNGELGRMRSGRATTGHLQGIMVDYYGSATPLIQLGTLSVPEPRLLQVQVFDASVVEGVEKAIQQADLGFNPSREGNVIRIAVPALTEERRKDLVKKLHKMAEEAKIAIRGHRRDSIDVLKKAQKDGDISEDDSRRGQDSVQKVTDRFTGEVDVLLAAKEKEMLEV